ncbi:hypothetical protein ACS0TY_034681 [Phlomoides rotata]
MDAEEKLVALKKAYADIILNTSKEAAVRIMSSERRAALYQHELKVAKEEALRMLLRLKQMMDFRDFNRIAYYIYWKKIQNIEAEAAALSQQKKIEELEAQLQEAEDIVADLREKLGELQDEMERTKKDNLQNVIGSNDASSREMANRVHPNQLSKFLHPNSLDEYDIASDVQVLLSQQNECSKSYHCKKVCTCGSYIRNRDLPSIISRNKEPGLYRNGCTQRIRACEGDPLDEESCLSQGIDKLMDTKNSEEQAEDKDTSKAPLLADIKLSSFHQKRKRATRRRKTVTASSRKCADLIQKTGQLSEPLTKHIPVSVKEDTHSSEDLSKVLQKDEGMNEKMVQSREETGFAEGSQSPVCKVDVEKLDMLSNSIVSNSSDIITGLRSESARERVIKYTFQRRHKRGALSRSEVNVPPEPEAEKRAGEKKNSPNYLEPSESSLLVESTRDSRRLAQVARQLISLSEKKWWS